jgi:hypothetical protein
MAKRHQSRRRRAYGPRQHELHERRGRRREEAGRSWLALAGEIPDIGLAQPGGSFWPSSETLGSSNRLERFAAPGGRVAD